MAGFSEKQVNICMIDDCQYNSDAVCTLELHQGSDECVTKCKVPQHTLHKIHTKVFSEENCTELTLDTSSKGSQRKWITNDKAYFIKECFYYQLRYWNDDMVEYIASSIGEQLKFNVVHQELGCINGRDCCYSPYWGDFKFIPFARLDKGERIQEYSTSLDRLKYALEIISEKTGLSAERYFFELLTLDFIIGNEDRHLSNFGVIFDGKNYCLSPCFDFGLGLFEHDNLYRSLTLEQALPKMSHKPFGYQLELIRYLESITSSASALLPEITIDTALMPNRLAFPYLKRALDELEVKYHET